MLTYSKPIFIISILVISLLAGSLDAQFIIQQSEYTVPLSYSLIPEDVEIESEEQETLFFMSIPIEKLIQAAREEGQEIDKNEQAIYVDGEKFATEYTSEQGKMSLISNANDGIIYNVIWPQKKVIVMTQEDLKNIEKQAEAMTQAMMEKMSPEMQEQIKAAMQEEKNKQSSVEQTAKPTGKKMTINGFSCELYMIEGEDYGGMGIWAASDDMNITGNIERMTGKFAKMFNMGEEDQPDEWSLIDGKIPVEVRQMSSDMAMGMPGFEITSIEKIEKKKPPVEKFYVPVEKDGFTRVSYSDYMKQMMPGQ